MIRDLSARWVRDYLTEDVYHLQMLKQHHIHLVNEETGEREPIQGCKRKDNPKLCKADYPRTSWLGDKPVVICPGLAEKMNMPAKREEIKDWMLARTVESRISERYASRNVGSAQIQF